MKTDQEMMESLKIRQRKYIAERRQRNRTIGLVACCLLAVIMTVVTINPFGKKQNETDTAENGENKIVLRLEKYRDGNIQINQVPTINDKTVYGYTFTENGDTAYVCLVADTLDDLREELAERGVRFQLKQSVITELSEGKFVVIWSDDDGYFGLYGENMTRKEFEDVYVDLNENVR